MVVHEAELEQTRVGEPVYPVKHVPVAVAPESVEGHEAFAVVSDEMDGHVSSVMCSIRA